MKITLSILLDLFFFCFASFCISFIWLRYFLDNTFLILFLSLIFSCFIGIIILLFKYRKANQKKLNKYEEFELNYLKSKLFLSDNKSLILFFQKIFHLRKNSSNLQSAFQCFYLENKSNYFVGHNNVFFTYYLNSFVLDDKQLKQILQPIITETYKENSSINSVYILCEKFSETALNFSKLYNFKIKFIIFNEFYKKIIKGLNLYTYTPKTIPKLKNRLKTFFNNLYNKMQTKTFIWCAISIFIASLVVRYNIYYIIFASFLFVLAILCKFKPENNF